MNKNKKNIDDDDGDTIYLDNGSSREESVEMYGKQKDVTDDIDSFSDEDFAGSGDYVYDDEDEIEDYTNESNENKNNIYDDIKRSQLNQVRG